MLSEADTHLITAAVDGELTPEQDRAFQILLATSEPAARLFAALNSDRNRLAALPRAKAPVRLCKTILAQVRTAAPRDGKRPVRWSKAKLTPIAMAASFLLAVSAGAYWLATSDNPQRLTVKQLQQLPSDDRAFAPRADRATSTGSQEEEVPTVEVSESPNPATPPTVSPSVVATSDTRPKTPAPEFDPKHALTANSLGSDIKAFDRVDVKLPLLLSFSDFAREESQASLRDRLNRDPATRIDLFARDTFKAVESLSQAGQVVNLNLIVETIAAERMKRKMSSTWVLFTDSLTAAETTKWLANAAEIEAKAETASPKVFGSAHVLTATAHEHKEAQLLAGVDLGLGKKSAEAQPNAHIAAKTLDQVASAIQKGDAQRPAILLTYLPPLARVHPALSKDVKQYHELRKDRKPGTVPVMIVIRLGNG